MKTWLMCSVVACAISAPAFADDKPAMEAPKPAEQVAAEAKAMGGTWKCSGTAAASPMGPEHKYDSTITFKQSPDKFWLVMSYEEKKSKAHPMAYKFTEYRTFDSKAGKWVATHIGEHGDLLNGDGGADGKDWTFKAVTTPMMPGDFHVVSTVKSPKEVELKGELMAADGAKPAFTTTCKK